MKMDRMAACLCVAVVAGCQADQRRVELISLTGGMAPIREQFNAGREKAQVVALLSPV